MLACGSHILPDLLYYQTFFSSLLSATEMRGGSEVRIQHSGFNSGFMSSTVYGTDEMVSANMSTILSVKLNNLIKWFAWSCFNPKEAPLRSVTSLSLMQSLWVQAQAFSPGGRGKVQQQPADRREFRTSRELSGLLPPWGWSCWYKWNTSMA